MGRNYKVILKMRHEQGNRNIGICWKQKIVQLLIFITPTITGIFITTLILYDIFKDILKIKNRHVPFDSKYFPFTFIHSSVVVHSPYLILFFSWIHVSSLVLPRPVSTVSRLLLKWPIFNFCISELRATIELWLFEN